MQTQTLIEQARAKLKHIEDWSSWGLQFGWTLYEITDDGRSAAFTTDSRPYPIQFRVYKKQRADINRALKAAGNAKSKD